jgi:hypothetical protein
MNALVGYEMSICCFSPFSATYEQASERTDQSTSTDHAPSQRLTLFRLDQSQPDIKRRRPYFTDPLLGLASSREIGPVPRGGLSDLKLAVTDMNGGSTFDPRMCDLNDRRVLFQVRNQRPDLGLYRSRPNVH